MGDRGQAFATLLATAFYSLARLSSLLPRVGGLTHLSRVPLLRDLTLTGPRATLFLKWAKNAQQPDQGFRVPLYPVSGTPACPVTLLRSRLLTLRDLGPHTPLFTFLDNQTPYTFTMGSARAFLALLLRGEGLAHQHYTFHSLRRGGCTLAFTEGALRSDLQSLGGWRSDAIDSYLPHFQARQRAARLLAQARDKSTPPPY